MIARSLLHQRSTFLRQRNSYFTYTSRRLPKARPALRTGGASTSRGYVSKSEADEKLEELQELYATAKDEFEIAAEETEKRTVYAAGDRAAAQEELTKLKTAFENAVQNSTPEVGEEIRNRVGSRVRELERAVEVMEEMAMED